MKPRDLDGGKPYEPPMVRKLTSSQASLFLVGHAYIGHQGARELLELMFPAPEDAEQTCIASVTAASEDERLLLHRRI